MSKLINLQLLLWQNAQLVDYKKYSFSGAAAKAGKAYFTGFHVLAFKLDVIFNMA